MQNLGAAAGGRRLASAAPRLVQPLPAPGTSQSAVPAPTDRPPPEETDRPASEVVRALLAVLPPAVLPPWRRAAWIGRLHTRTSFIATA
eukprot:scaffold134152_cov27-Tisochrysis_lutea.AAC.1